MGPVCTNAGLPAEDTNKTNQIYENVLITLIVNEKLDQRSIGILIQPFNDLGWEGVDWYFGVSIQPFWRTFFRDFLTTFFSITTTIIIILSWVRRGRLVFWGFDTTFLTTFLKDFLTTLFNNYSCDGGGEEGGANRASESFPFSGKKLAWPPSL